MSSVTIDCMILVSGLDIGMDAHFILIIILSLNLLILHSIIIIVQYIDEKHCSLLRN